MNQTPSVFTRKMLNLSVKYLNFMSITSKKKKVIGIGVTLLILAIICSVYVYANVTKHKQYSEYINLANNYLLEKNYKEALSLFEKAVDVNDKSTEVRVSIAKSYIGMNQRDNAIEILKKAQSLDIKNEELNLEILDIVSKIDRIVANDLASNFLNKVGLDNVSDNFKRTILEKTNKEVLNEVIEAAEVLNLFIVEFENNKVKLMPDDLADKYIARLQSIEKEKETEAKMYNHMSNGEGGQILEDAKDKYESTINEIYNDLDKYLSNDEKSQLLIDKESYKKSKEDLDYEFDNLDPMFVVSHLVQTIPE